MFPLGQSYWFGFEFLSHSWSIGVVHLVVGSMVFIFLGSVTGVWFNS